MGDTTRIEYFKILLSSLRTISIKNAANKLGIELSEMLDILTEMENLGYLRIIAPKGCGSSCSSCDSSSCVSPSGYTGEEIIISLLFNRTKEYADE